MRARQTVLATAVLSALLGAASLGVASPTHADPVQGGPNSNPTDDWGTDSNGRQEHIIRSGGTYAVGDYAGLWQGILWADGNLTECSVDGIFGSGSAAATRSWQSARGLGADGVVGPATWQRADNSLAQIGSGTQEPNVRYLGSTGRILYFARANLSGNYFWNWRFDSAYENASHPDRRANYC